MFTVLAVKLDFTQFPEFNTQVQEYATELCLGVYDAIDVLNVVHRVEELFKFPVLEAIISYNGYNVHVIRTSLTTVTRPHHRWGLCVYNSNIQTQVTHMRNGIDQPYTGLTEDQ